MERIDMLVIGSGPAGRRAAVQSAKLGKSVLVVDRGGAWAGFRCIPGRSRRRRCARPC